MALLSPEKRSDTAASLRFQPLGPDIYGATQPQALLSSIQEDGEALFDLSDQHVVSIRPFRAETLLQLFRLAAKFESNPNRYITHNLPLKGKILINAFYEPSTRTRLSFDSAWHRLGGDSINITDRSSTGIAKGESLSDVAHMFNNYGDCVVLRDNHAEAVYQMTESLRIPIINAGNGIDQHPTQAMADLFTLFKWRPQLASTTVPRSERVRIGIVGIPNRMRTVRSLLHILAKFPQIVETITIIYDPHTHASDQLFDPGQLEELREAGLNIQLSTNLHREIPELDVIYINAIAWVGDSYEVHGSSFRLTRDLPYKPDAIVLHPLARGPELSTCMDDTPHNWYFSQARGAVFLRMALLTCLVDRTDRVMDVI
ncbi:aspartate carbamoyltransferase [Synechococcus sp. HK05]|uniref:aspartate/ornithine carbamoyltransferase family protein n=1 Tax=Synechococcus sp. HK05 TaxID=2725975 RepID=UPI001C384B45|nr:aspartate carbamoyltransferase [Synechococcus sp. HK05]MBV2351801.1 aspartate carbamoyltransferase [Synechococcus sp. HK05]